VIAGEGNRSKTVSLRPKPLRPYEDMLLGWLRSLEAKPSRLEVSKKAQEFYKEEVSDVGAQKRFKAGSSFVDQFLAKTKTKDLVAQTSSQDEATDKTSACDECGQAFPSNSQLKQHKFSEHYSEKPFSCPHCGRGFKSGENLKIHVRTHTGEKPYSCDVCGYASADPSNFRKHQKNHHQINKPSGKILLSNSSAFADKMVFNVVDHN
jgi:hypothetical protein